jgi:uncharacterized C2H2 Zn-finger protein
MGKQYREHVTPIIGPKCRCGRCQVVFAPRASYVATRITALYGTERVVRCPNCGAYLKAKWLSEGR